MHWKLQLVQVIGGWSVAARLCLCALCGLFFGTIGCYLIHRYRYHLLGALVGAIVVYWIVSAFR